MEDPTLENTVIRIRKGDQQVIREIYAGFRDDFVEWAFQNYSVDSGVALDAFQEAVIALYRNALEDKVQEYSATPKTYLYTIAKRKLIDRKEKDKHRINFSDHGPIDHKNHHDPISMAQEKDHIKKIVRENLDKLEEKDRKVLELYYLKGYDMESIARELNYKNANVAKKKKFESFKKLAELVRDKLGVLIL